MTQIDDYERRFTGVRTLYGDAFDKFTNAIVYVIGVGGVGSWTAESLARTAIGKIVLVDMDVLVASNINRQLPALTDTIGESKIDVMAQRIRGINPKIELELVDDFLTPENVTTILPTKAQVQAWLADGKRVVVLDCVDDMAAKFAIAMHCRFNKIDCVISGGVGAKSTTAVYQQALSSYQAAYHQQMANTAYTLPSSSKKSMHKLVPKQV